MPRQSIPKRGFCRDSNGFPHARRSAAIAPFQASWGRARLERGMPGVKLTVAIPSYRRPEDLRRALEALSKQSRRADEVIVVAREGDTSTRNVAHEFVSVLPLKVELVERPGMVEAVNRAFDTATGDVIALTDDDAA